MPTTSLPQTSPCLERGCPAAALRVWPWKTTEKTPIELCGDTLDTYKQILSETNVLQMSFYLADKAVGAKGFKATWTEIKVEKKQVYPFIGENHILNHNQC